MKTCGRHNLESNGIPYSTLLPGYKGRTTGPAAGNSSHFLYHIVGSTADALRASPRCVSRLLTLRLRYVFHATSPGSGGAPLPLRRYPRVRAGTHLPTLLGLRQGQLYVAVDSDIRLPRYIRGKRAFLSLYTIKMQVSLILLMRKLKIAKCTNTVMKFAHFCQLISASFIKNQPYTVVYD